MSTVISLSLENVIATLVRYRNVVPLDVRYPVVVPAGLTVELRLRVPRGRVFIPALFRMDCAPSEALIVSHEIDGKVIVPPYTCIQGVFSEWLDFAKFGYPVWARDELKITAQNVSTSDALLVYEAAGVYMPVQLYDKVVEKLYGVIDRWLG